MNPLSLKRAWLALGALPAFFAFGPTAWAAPSPQSQRIAEISAVDRELKALPSKCKAGGNALNTKCMSERILKLGERLQMASIDYPDTMDSVLQILGCHEGDTKPFDPGCVDSYLKKARASLERARKDLVAKAKRGAIASKPAPKAKAPAPRRSAVAKKPPVRKKREALTAVLKPGEQENLQPAPKLPAADPAPAPPEPTSTPY
jgi:hypothetical protein